MKLQEAATQTEIDNTYKVIYPAVANLPIISKSHRALTFVLPHDSSVTFNQVKRLVLKSAASQGLRSIKIFDFSSAFETSMQQSMDAYKTQKDLEKAYSTPAAELMVADWKKLNHDAKDLNNRITLSNIPLEQLYFQSYKLDYKRLSTFIETLGYSQLEPFKTIRWAFNTDRFKTTNEEDIEEEFSDSLVEGRNTVCILSDIEISKLKFDLNKYSDITVLPAE